MIMGFTYIYYVRQVGEWGMEGVQHLFYRWEGGVGPSIIV